MRTCRIYSLCDLHIYCIAVLTVVINVHYIPRTSFISFPELWTFPSPSSHSPSPPLFLKTLPPPHICYWVTLQQFSQLPRNISVPFHSFISKAWFHQAFEPVTPVSNHLIGCEKVAPEMKVTKASPIPWHYLCPPTSVFLLMLFPFPLFLSLKSASSVKFVSYYN